MNIHFDDKELYCDLLNVTVNTITVGSHMYGMENENSDLDLLHLYLEPSNTLSSFMWEHHQLQHKHKGIDHNFSTVQSFIRNALTGDATINFECIFSDSMKKSSLRWIWDKRHSFINYNIIKSYLGMAKRDLKSFNKESNNSKLNSLDISKKLSHFYRGIIFAEMLLDGEFSLDLKGKHHVFAKGGMDDHTFLMSLKDGLWFEDRDTHLDLLKEQEQKMDSLRDELNKRLDDRKIVKFMEPEVMQSIDYDLRMYHKTVMESSKLTIDYKDIFYNALESGITY